MQVVVLGMGRVGRPLAAALELKGTPPIRLGRRETSVGRHQDLSAADLAFLTVPDQALSQLAREIHSLPRYGLVHCSGQVMNEAVGQRVAMFHPVMSFRGDETADIFKGCPIGITGAVEVVQVLTTLANDLGSIPFTLAEDKKPTYHLAAMFASVFPYILLLKAGELARQAGVPDDQVGAIFGPIFRRAADHLQLDHRSQGITGPVSRKDGRTLGQHLEALDGDADGQALYRLLTKLSIEYADLDQAAKQELTEALA